MRVVLSCHQIHGSSQLELLKILPNDRVRVYIGRLCVETIDLGFGGMEWIGRSLAATGLNMGVADRLGISTGTSASLSEDVSYAIGASF